MRLSGSVHCIGFLTFLFLVEVVRGGVEPPPATYQIAMLPLQHRTVGKAGVEPAVSCSQGTRGAVPHPPGFCFASVARMGIEPIPPA